MGNSVEPRECSYGMVVRVQDGWVVSYDGWMDGKLLDGWKDGSVGRIGGSEGTIRWMDG